MHKDSITSLRRDMRHVLWSGLRLQDDVDACFWIEKLSGSCRLIQMCLKKPGLVVDLSTGQDFDLETIGREYTNLETREQEMMVVARHVNRVVAVPEESSVKVRLVFPGGEQCFRLAAGIEGRWDWFVNPREIPGGAAVLLVPLPMKETWRLMTV